MMAMEAAKKIKEIQKEALAKKYSQGENKK
jgi:hypothetical protein